MIALLQAALAAAPPAPFLGLADLHFHMFSHLQHGCQFYAGYPTGTLSEALDACGAATRGERGWRSAPVRQHASLVPAKILKPLKFLEVRAFKDERNDDIPNHHPPYGPSPTPGLPHWLGWPTSDSIAHQQGWQGWLRLAHDGLPALHHLAALRASDPDITLQDALTSFYRRYAANMKAAADDGVAGLNLVVLSLVNASTSCKAITGKHELKEHPLVCTDMTSVIEQHAAVVAWARGARSWAEVVTDPTQAAAAIAAGKLAVVLSVEATDVFGPAVLTRSPPDPSVAAPAAPSIAALDRPGIVGPARLPRAESETFRLRSYVERGARPDGIVDARAGIRSWLDDPHAALRGVTTLQPAHQLDNPFFGGATIQTRLVWTSYWRLRHTDGCADLQPHRAPIEELRRCWLGAATSPDTPPVLAVLARSLARRESLPAGYEGPDDGQIVHNPYGMSEDGKALVDVMVERHMPIDVAHMSWVGVEQLLAHLKERGKPSWPLYASHVHPEGPSMVRREQNLPDGLLDNADFRAHGPLLGLRPGDDEHVAATLPEASPKAVPACQGTSVGTLVFAKALARAGVVTFGSDLNGFINQTRPVGQLRPEPGGQCGAFVPDFGSELRTRGLAHVGLLPAQQLEMAFAAEDAQDAALAAGFGLGAWAYLEGWTRAYSGDAPAARPPPPRDPAVVYRDLLYEGCAHELSAFTEGFTARARLLEGCRLRTIVVEGVVGAAGPVELPLLRALEGRLPYQEQPTGRPSYAQIPTTIGLAVGSQSYTAYPRVQHFPYDRCRYDATVRITEEQVSAYEEHCAPLAAQAAAYREAERTGGGAFSEWERELRMPWTPDLPLPAELGPARRVHAWLGEADHAGLLANPWFENAPVPGLGGLAPAAWFAANPPTSHADREGAHGYCALLREAFPEQFAGTTRWCGA